MTHPEKRKLSREEIAKIEVGRTEISPVLSRFLTFTMLAVMVSVPLVEQGYDLYKKRVLDGDPRSLPYAFEVFKSFPSFPEIKIALREEGILGGVARLNAEVLRRFDEYENTLDEESVLVDAILPTMQSLLVGYLKAGNENAYCGRGEWLYYRPGIDYLTGRGFLDPAVMEYRRRTGNEWTPPPQPDPLRAVLEFHEQLRKRGISLIVMPVPVKAMIYPERFSRRYRGDRILQNPSYHNFRDELERAGVLVCDVGEDLLELKQSDHKKAYLATDTHWTPEGVQRAARKLARLIDSENLLDEKTPRRFLRREVRVTNLGDVAVMLNLPDNQPFYSSETVTFHQVLTPDGAPWEPSRQSDILFLGDSFSNIYSLEGMGWGTGGGLVAQLSAELERPIDAILINDKGSYVTRQQLARDLAKGEDRLRGKKVVVYEFAMRELAVGDWKTGLIFSPGKKTGSARKEEKALPIHGTIRSLSHPPQPGSVPYRDCIIAVELADVSVASGTDEVPKNLLVFMWGMRDNQWTRAARYRPGQNLDISIVPWSSVEERYGSYNRVEPDDEETLWLETYWTQTSGSSPRSQENASASSGEIKTPVSSTPADTVMEEKTRLFLQDLVSKLEQLEAEKRNVWVGKEGWLFFGPELRSLVVGPFWGENASRVSRARKPEYADPLPAILDFHSQLRKAGIRLILVPVPAKAIVYPDFISDVDIDGNHPLPRHDIYNRQFFEILRNKGIEILDLTEPFLVSREKGKVFCRTDTHWSPLGCRIAAEEIAKRIEHEPWFEDVPRREFLVEERTLPIAGDLWRYLGNRDLPKETLSLLEIREVKSETSRPVTPWRESPVLLLGDSHNLVFHSGGDMHATGAGLPDLLARELGFPVDLVAVRGSGATPARMNLLRRRDNLQGKKVVVWCFTTREFTEAPGGWRKLPVIR